MGRKNVLIEGASGTGKTSVGEELARRGFCVIHGDRELAYQGDPSSGAPVEVAGLAVHRHHIWDVGLVEEIIADQREPATFFCGGSRNHRSFIDLFDAVFVLDVDLGTLIRRLDERSEGEWGGPGRLAERELITRLHRTRAGLPEQGIAIDAAVPLTQVVDEILVRSLGVASSADGWAEPT